MSTASNRLRAVPRVGASVAGVRETEKAIQAFKLRASGLDLDDIATRLGYRNRSGAHKAVERGARLLPHSELGTFKLELDHEYRAMYAGIRQRATHGDTWAIDRALEILKGWKALWGADAPQRRLLEVIPFEKVEEEIAWLEEERASLPEEDRPPLELPEGQPPIDVESAPVADERQA